MSGMRLEFANLMEELGTTDETLVVIVGDISHGILREFARKNPERYFNIGILEPAMIGIAAGMAKQGLNPVVHTIAPFLVERAFEQLKLDFGYQQLSGNLISVGGSFDYSQLGVSHHSYSDVSLIAQIDNSMIFLPGSVSEFRDLFLENYTKPGLKYFRLTEFPHEIPLPRQTSWTEGEVVMKPGSDLTVVTAGRSLATCLEAAELLDNEISIEIVYCPVLKPFKGRVLEMSVKKTGRYLFVDELSTSGGLASLLWRFVASIPNSSGSGIGVQKFVHQYGHFQEVLDAAGLSAASLVEKIRTQFL